MDIAFEPTLPLPVRLPTFDVDAARSDTARERTQALHGLPKGRMLSFDGPQGQEVTCQRGSLRIRHDGEGHDHLLAAGQSYCAEHDGRMRVFALDDALLWSSGRGGVMAGVISHPR